MTIQNQDTRDIINTARDLLVGKVPTPIDQCEEITRALIYKYISAVDAESVEMGGNASYFTGDGEELRWDKMMAPEQTANSVQRLYTRGLEMLGNSSDIPEAFQTIYRDAYLPYNDAVVLRDFLQTIDRFDTRDTEQIGDAYEMMLQTFGAQAAAGQFRTPRHIIDFIVGIVNPQKHETILDPACGTAGFLASAYQHIAAAGTLTPLDSRVLADSTVGYDISPQMTRIATVNLYLTHRQEPKVTVYDTLTSEEKWNDHYDVILANPPFMTPKGGIRPHRRFFSNSKRCEVLFVDYIMGHLNEGGRAGVIVPDSVISQSHRAHIQLRRLLLENALVAVISLPIGVFQPYSGNKTSILIMDKTLARRADSIAFFKAENDGYDLGAQRRPIHHNDLPAIMSELTEYLRRVRVGDRMDVFSPAMGLVVEKGRIVDGGDYNLSGERYRENEQQSFAYPLAAIGDIIESVTPPMKIQKTEFSTTGKFPIIDQSQTDIAGWTDDESAVIYPDRPLVIFGDHTCAVKFIDGPFAQGADGIKILKTKDVIEPLYLFHTLRAKPIEPDGYKRHFSKLRETRIPLPPLEVQRELIEEVEGYQRAIDEARSEVVRLEQMTSDAVARVWQPIT